MSNLIQTIKGKVRKLLTPKKVKAITYNNKTFFLHNPPFFLESQIYWKGFENFDWEINTRRIWSELCMKSDNIFDVGANTGIFAMLAKAQNPSASVYAFEPQPNIYSILKKNNSINKFDVACENMAVSDTVGKLPFYNYGEDTFGKNNTTAGSLNQKWRPDKQSSIDVEVTTLDSYIDDKKINKIDLLKIDVETLEVEVLRGFKNHLYQFRPVVVLEIQNTEIGTAIKSFFNEENYSFFNIDESAGLVKVDNLGAEKDKNYIICPDEKLNLIMNAELPHKN